MASNHGGKDVMVAESSEANNAETMVEIKIKTLDSQTYTLRVDKCVPVPALKEQIASVTGVLSEQQRLICRGKVLKDDQLLSAYHVEDGHTLHMVSRQPFSQSQANIPDHTANDPVSSARQSMGSQHGPSVVVGTFNISEQGDGSLPDFSRIVSAVLGSFGMTNSGSGGEAIDLQQHIAERLSQIPGLNEIRNSSGQPEDASGMSQHNLQDATFTHPTDVSMESLQLPVIPDSLSTLSQYIRRLRHQFNENSGFVGHSSQSLGSGSGAETSPPHSAATQGGLPTPAALGEVTESARQLLIEQARECLGQLTGHLRYHSDVTDPVARIRMQSHALRSGALLQNLGAFLLELGRTTMTLRLGQNPTDAVVNAGPAVFISTSGPNPIMVQPLPFQPGTSFGTTPSGAGNSFSVGSSLRPRNIDIRIRTGPVLSPAVNQREVSGGERSATDPAPFDGGVSNHEATLRNLSQSRGGPDVRVVPIRISSLPPGLAPTESSRTSVSVLYPVLARAQHVDSGNINGANGQRSNGIHPSSGENRQPEIPGTAGGILHNGERSGLEQLLRNILPGELNHGNNVIFQTTGSETAQIAVNSQETTTVSDQGRFLSNLLHEIMPVVTRHINAGGDGAAVADVADGATQPSSSVEENQGRGSSSRPSDDSSSLPNSKRQKTE